MRANEFSDELKALQSNIDSSIILLHHLIGVLSNGVKAEENKTFVASKIDGVQTTVEESRTIVTSKINEVQSTVGNLPSAQQVDENRTIITSKIDGVQSALCDMVENAQEVYTPVINAPAPSHTVRLDFGNASTPEGLLKKSVLVVNHRKL